MDQSVVVRKIVACDVSVNFIQQEIKYYVLCSSLTSRHKTFITISLYYLLTVSRKCKGNLNVQQCGIFLKLKDKKDKN